jgi:hypothetical protein
MNLDNVGFDLKDTPFGKSKFDLYNFGGSDYEEVSFDYIFDGMIFYKPIAEMKFAEGIPEVYPEEYEKQFYQRLAMIDGITYEEAVEEYAEFLEQINTLKYSSLPDSTKAQIEEQINLWLK